MQALAVLPRTPGSLHLREVERPALDAAAGRDAMLVRVLRVGLCGTDGEIEAGEFGTAPDGDDHLVIGHESLGRVEAVGPDVPAPLRPGTLVAAMVRRPGRSIYDRLGMADLTTDADVRERGINRLHGFLAEWYVDSATFLVPLPDSLEAVGVLTEPMSIVEKGVRQAFEIQRRLRIWRPARAAVMGAGTIGLLACLALRLRGLEVTVYSRRRPPYLASDLVEAVGGRYESSQEVDFEALADRDGAYDLVVEATGFSPLAFEAPLGLAANGVIVLASVTGGDRVADVPTDRVNQRLVLGNGVVVGTVNAAREDFVEAVEDMLRAEAFHPGWLGRLLTTRVRGLAAHGEMLHGLRHDPDAIKVYVDVAGR